MGQRRRFILLVALGLVVFWFLILLLCSPQSGDNLDRWPARKTRRSSTTRNQIIVPYVDSQNYMKHFQVRPLSLREILFYDFNPISARAPDSSSSSISKTQHDNITQQLGTLKNFTDKYVKSEGSKLFAYNLLVSNRIGPRRPLPDTRNSKCNELARQAAPSKEARVATFNRRASIIICYYNEAPSALLRTVTSLLDRSPNNLIEEIIVVDDFSDEEYHMTRMEPLVSSKKVLFLRTTQREGLIRARLFGARVAQGDVLIFLDSHVEANIGWLEPLLEVVQENRTTVACPMIDVINAETLIYSASPMVRGGVNWSLNFRWDSVPSSQLKSYADFVKPIESPTMAGGLYAINREYFYQLGAYDSGMELWGGENIEISFRIWMCGGRIVILPCSRLGHIFRKTRPYGPQPGQPDSLLFNSHRSARVWLGEHIEQFYEASPSARFLSSGDVSKRMELKKNLNCKNFTWYIENVYPQLGNETSASSSSSSSSPKGDSFAKPTKLFQHSRRFDRSVDRAPIESGRVIELERLKALNSRIGHRQKMSDFLMSSHKQVPGIILRFQIQLQGSNLCIGSGGSLITKGFNRLFLESCFAREQQTTNPDNSTNSHTHQTWSETESRDLRLGDNHCLDLSKNLPLLRKCHNMGSFQNWSHHNDTQGTHIFNPGGNLCLGVEKIQVGEPLIVTICDTDFNETVAQPRQQTNHLQSSLRDRHLAAGWRTGPSNLQFNRIDLKSVQPIQKWNLIVQ